MKFIKRLVVYVFIATTFLVAAYSLGVTTNKTDNSISYESPSGSLQFLQVFFLQLGVAVAISATVFELVERAHRSRLADAEKAATERTLGDVARKAFSSFFDDALIQKAMSGVFATPFVRKDFELRYCFKDYEPLDDVLIIDAHFQFTIQNVGQVTAKYDYIGMLSSQFAPFSKMKQRPKPEFLHLNIGGNDVNEQRLKRLNKRIKVDRATQGYSISKKDLRPGEILKIKGGIRSYKFRSDSEVFRTYFPSEQALVTVQDNTTENLYFDIYGIGDISELRLEPAIEGSTRYEAKVEEILLPYYGWVLSWVDLNKFSDGDP